MSKFKSVIVVNDTDCPDDVAEEIREELWPDNELGNDVYYYSWDKKWQEPDQYPKLYAFLESEGIEECLIHFLVVI